MLINETKRLLKHKMLSSHPTSLMIWGPPGVGKSQAVKEVAEELGWNLIDLRLLLLNPVDLRGIPVPNRELGVAEWFPASFLPNTDRHGAKGILFIDEINAAPSSLQASSYQLVLDRRCGEYVLPDGWRIIAAGNNATDKSIVSRMPSALANRMTHLEVDCDLTDWKSWALTHDVDPMVVSFLNYRQELLFKMPDGIDQIKGFPSPRTWEFVSNDIKDYHGDIEAAYPFIVGNIGSGPATEFLAYSRVYGKLPDIERILDRGEGETVTGIDLLYAVCGALVSSLVRKQDKKRFANFLGYISRIPREFQVLAVKDCFSAKLETLLVSIPAFSKWAEANSDVIL
ncbi:MAG: MoxR family ATPase [Coprothermobacterota bacterium]|nr:MoxR family ATPase [Coprothermobacterota bacterium]